MKAGRELDALVAERVMGWEWQKHPDHDIRYFRPTNIFRYGAIAQGDLIEYTDQLPAYSTDMAAAWQVVDHLLEMRGEDGHYYKECFVMNVAEDGLGDLVRWSSAHAAHIICLAALRALNVATPPDTSRS